MAKTREAAILDPRVAKPNGTFHRKVEVLTNPDESFYIQVGVPSGNGIEFLDDKKVASKVLEELAARGWRVHILNNPNKSAVFRPAEVAVMTGVFYIERITN